jgi:hypothetical protein
VFFEHQLMPIDNNSIESATAVAAAAAVAQKKFLSLSLSQNVPHLKKKIEIK